MLRLGVEFFRMFRAPLFPVAYNGLNAVRASAFPNAVVKGVVGAGVLAAKCYWPTAGAFPEFVVGALVPLWYHCFLFHFLIVPVDQVGV